MSSVVDDRVEVAVTFAEADDCGDIQLKPAGGRVSLIVVRGVDDMRVLWGGAGECFGKGSMHKSRPDFDRVLETGECTHLSPQECIYLYCEMRRIRFTNDALDIECLWRQLALDSLHDSRDPLCASFPSNLLAFADFLSRPFDMCDIPALSPDFVKSLVSNSFITNYVAYRHYRKSGWVVSTGIKYAADFTLYKRGPSFDHAAFAVDIYRSSCGRTFASVNMREIMQRIRVVCQVRKRLRLAVVDFQLDIAVEDFGGLMRCLHGVYRSVDSAVASYTVFDRDLSRWLPEKSRT